VNFGNKCIEIDALTPGEIRQRLKESINSHIDQAQWQKLQAVERLERETICKAFSKWGAIA